MAPFIFLLVDRQQLLGIRLRAFHALDAASLKFHYADKHDKMVTCNPAPRRKNLPPRGCGAIQRWGKQMSAVSLNDEPQPKLCEAGRSTGQKSPANNKGSMHNRSQVMLTSPLQQTF